MKEKKLSDKRKGFRKVFWSKTPWYKNLYFSDVTINGLWIFIIILFLVWAYAQDTAAYKEVYEDPCAYCVAASYCDPIMSDNATDNFYLEINFTGVT